MTPINEIHIENDRPPVVGIALILAFQGAIWFVLGFLARPVLEAWWKVLT